MFLLQISGVIGVGYFINDLILLTLKKAGAESNKKHFDQYVAYWGFSSD